MWRRHAQKVSRAEEKVLAELCRRGLGRGLSTQHGVEFNGEAEGVEGTWIDFAWSQPVLLAVFIDGEQLHLKRRQQLKDGLIDAALRRRGYAVARYRYKPPLSKRRLREICDGIEERLRPDEVGV